MNGGLLAALAGLGVGVGYVLYAKQKAAAPKASACETACVAAAKLAGVTGDLTTLCKGTCALVDTDFVKSGGIGGAIAGWLGPKVAPVTHTVNQWIHGKDDCFTCCPDNSVWRPGHDKVGSCLACPPGATRKNVSSTNRAGDCVDASGKVVEPTPHTLGTVDATHFIPWGTGAVVPTPPVSSSGGWSSSNPRGGSGGVTVTYGK
jgi:hypothetical protein